MSLDLLATVTDEEWRQPTPCPEWTVLGLCCHLVGDDFSLPSRHRDEDESMPSPSFIPTVYRTLRDDWRAGSCAPLNAG